MPTVIINFIHHLPTVKIVKGRRENHVYTKVLTKFSLADIIYGCIKCKNYKYVNIEIYKIYYYLYYIMTNITNMHY